ncbi:HNH endonuclease [Ammoniphilus sp. YIM 78166]|uniref:HNH endonuclease n=1 Tax=Ammoniphilus sp. YIM 78166 TaxID=1644106 RepID=UPI0010702E37|nr:HNH endonuclease [Ammoniphilus sp. YIM 78166]
MKNEFEIVGETTVLYVRYKVYYLRVFIDTADLEKVQSYRGTWFAGFDDSGKRYYIHGKDRKNGVNKTIMLHRWITDCPDGMVVDHIDRNSLNNKRENLRVISAGENMQNRKIHSNNTSGVRGVSWYKKTGQWRVQICLQGKMKNLGLFDHFDDAVAVSKAAYQDFMPYSEEDDDYQKAPTLFDFTY